MTPEEQWIAGRLLDYQQSLITRRWNFFSAYVVVIGILFNAYGKAGGEQHFRIVACVLAVMLSVLDMQFVSLAARRIEAVQARLQTDYSLVIVDAPIDGGGAFTNSITTLLYCSISIVALSWITLSFYLCWYWGVGLLLFFVLSLLPLRFRRLHAHDASSEGDSRR